MRHDSTSEVGSANDQKDDALSFFGKTKAKIEGLKKTNTKHVIWEEFIQAGKNLMFDFI